MNALILALLAAIGQHGIYTTDVTRHWGEANWRSYLNQHPYVTVVKIEDAQTVLCQGYGLHAFRKIDGPYVRITGIPTEGLRWRHTKIPALEFGPPGSPPLWGNGTMLEIGNPGTVTLSPTGVPTLTY